MQTSFYYANVNNVTFNCLVVLSTDFWDFNVVHKNEYNEVKWKSHLTEGTFKLEHSSDGYDWKQLTSQNAKSLNYVFKQYNFSSNNYYRLSINESSEIIYINNVSSAEKIEKMYNLLGQEVDVNYKGIVIIRYIDGRTKKQLNN